MPSKTGRLVNKKELAQIFGVSPQAVDGWLGRGLPFNRKGSALQGYEFDTSAVIAWKADRDLEDALLGRGESGTDDAKNNSRKLAADASFAELKFAREAGQLITIEDAEAEWGPRISNCRARLLALPSKIAVRAHAAESVEEVQSIVQVEVDEALNELADGAAEFTDVPESSDGDSEAEEFDTEDVIDIPPPTEANRLTVGRPIPKA